MKKFKYIIIALFVSLFMTDIVYAQNVHDEANVLSYDEVQKLQSLADEFKQMNDIEIVFVTTRNRYNSRQSYLETIYSRGSFSSHAILYLIDITDFNSFGLLTKGEGIRYIDDGNRVERVHDAVEAAETAYGEANYYAMFKVVADTSSKYIEQGVAPDYEHSYIDEDGNLQWERVFPWGMFILISLGVSTVVIVILILRNKMVKKATRATEYLDKESIRFTKAEDQFIGTHTSRIHIPKSSGGGGGGGRSGGGRSSGGGSRR